MKSEPLPYNTIFPYRLREFANKDIFKKKNKYYTLFLRARAKQQRFFAFNVKKRTIRENKFYIILSKMGALL